MRPTRRKFRGFMSGLEKAVLTTNEFLNNGRTQKFDCRSRGVVQHLTVQFIERDNFFQFGASVMEFRSVPSSVFFSGRWGETSWNIRSLFPEQHNSFVRPAIDLRDLPYWKSQTKVRFQSHTFCPVPLIWFVSNWVRFDCLTFYLLISLRRAISLIISWAAGTDRLLIS